MSRNGITDLLFSLRRKGITVWTDNGQLRYRATKEPLSTEELEALRTGRAEIVALLQQTSSLSADQEPKLAPRNYADPVPLSFSQQWWWNGFELGGNPSMREIHSAVRLTDNLSIGCLRRSVAELVCRHEALRTRIIATSDGALVQRIEKPGELPLEMIDLTRLSRSAQQAEIKLRAQQLVNEPISVARGPLFLARLLKLGDLEHLLIVALDHIISDIASLGILWRDLFTLYAQFSRGLPCSLAKLPIQFADYAVWQQNTRQWWLNKHGPYWKRQLEGVEPVRLFRDERPVSTTPFRRERLPVQFSETLSSTLRELGRRARTTTAMSVLTAYAASIFRLSHRTDLVVPLITAGRLHPETQNTVGFFGTPAFLRLQIHDRDTFLDLLTHITNEYGSMYPHQDSCRIAMQLSDPDVMWNPHFNWIPAEFNTPFSEDTRNCDTELAVRIEPYRLDIDSRALKWGDGIGLMISDTPDGIAGMLGYRADMFAPDSMERFARTIHSCAEKLAFEPYARVKADSLE